MPILPKDSGNILRLALPTSSDNRIQKTQRIILPSQISESVKVVEATGSSHLPLPAHLAHLAQPRKVHEIQLNLQKLEPYLLFSNQFKGQSEPWRNVDI